MDKLSLVWLGAFLLPGFAAAQSGEGWELKGLRPGQSEAEVKASVPALRCRASEMAKVQIVSCLALDAGFAGDPKATLFTNLHRGKAVSVRATFAPGNFTAAVDALIAKFGKPSSDEVSEVQNRMGATFVQREVVWRAGVLEILASRLGSSVTESSVTLTDTAAAEVLMAEITAKAASDI